MKKEWNFHDESDTHCLPEFGRLGREATYLSFASFCFKCLKCLKSMHLFRGLGVLVRMSTFIQKDKGLESMHILVNPATRRRTGRAAAETRNKPNLHQANALGAELAPDRGDPSCQDKEAQISCLALLQMLYII
jgi:hypothetical protein